MDKKNVAVILAGGAGTRSGFAQPKQLVPLAGVPVIAHALRCFDEHPKIHEICIVAPYAHVATLKALCVTLDLRKVRHVVNGGAERRDSSFAAIQAYESEGDASALQLIFHDAVRPLISRGIIDRVLSGLETFNAVDVAIKAADTVIAVDPSTNNITSIPVRAHMRLGQTPQGFAFRTIARAHRAARGDPQAQQTDDCGVVLTYLADEPIHVVEGDIYNHKLTFNEDLAILEALQAARAPAERSIPAPLGPKLGASGTFVVLTDLEGLGDALSELSGSIALDLALPSDVLDPFRHTDSLRKALDRAEADRRSIDAVIYAPVLPHQAPEEEQLFARAASIYKEALEIAGLLRADARVSGGQLIIAPVSRDIHGPPPPLSRLITSTLR